MTRKYTKMGTWIHETIDKKETLVGDMEMKGLCSIFYNTTGDGYNKSFTITTITCEGCGCLYYDDYVESWPKCDDCREKYWEKKVPYFLRSTKE